MTDRTHPEAGSTHIIRYALELGLLWIDGSGRDKVREALDALDALEAKLASIGAGGVQALSAAPAVPNGDELRRIARSARTSASDDASPTEYVLAGWKAAMLAASPTPPAEQQAAPKAATVKACVCGEPQAPGTVHRVDGPCYVAEPQQAAPKAEPGEPYQDSTPHLSVGDSSFESWYESYCPAHKSDKQLARDAYAAGMGDPLVMAAPQPAPAPLSDAQIKELIEDGVFLGNCKKIVRAIEHAHGITQKGGKA